MSYIFINTFGIAVYIIYLIKVNGYDLTSSSVGRAFFLFYKKKYLRDSVV